MTKLDLTKQILLTLIFSASGLWLVSQNQVSASTVNAVVVGIHGGGAR